MLRDSGVADEARVTRRIVLVPDAHGMTSCTTREQGTTRSRVGVSGSGVFVRVGNGVAVDGVLGHHVDGEPGLADLALDRTDAHHAK